MQMKGFFFFYLMAQLRNTENYEQKQKCNYVSDLIVSLYQLATVKENLHEI